MYKFAIELKWGINFFVASLLWMLLERLIGLHSVHISEHYIYTNLFAIIAILIFVFALLDKRKNFYSGKMTWKQGFISGFIITLIIVILAGYVILLGIYRLGWQRQVRDEPKPDNPGQFVSVIVPARNEEMTIVSWLRSLLDQDYHMDYEVIVVDDHSEDQTVGHIDDFFGDEPGLKVIRLIGASKGKKRALQAVSLAT